GAQLPVLLALGDAEGIEVCRQVAHGAVGADQHERADAVLGGAQGGRRAQVETAGRGPGLELAADAALGLAVVACQGAQELAVAFRGLLQGPRPGRPPMVSIWAIGAPALLLQAGEEVPPLVADRSGVALVLRLHLLDVGSV